MNNTPVIVAVVVGVSVIVSAALLSTALRDLGRSMEKAASSQPRVHIPSSFSLSLEGKNSPLRLDVNNKP